MAIIKCKMCGGDLEVVAGSSVMECEYCGTQQTVPNADNEKKLTLFGRANRLRMACEFDKAAGVYESIVAEFPEEAEAYWGLVLCKYGIEYVDDPATGKKIPTCHRSSFDSVMDDVNLEQALENADAVARKVYRDEAKAMEELRKGIIEVSGKEEPYDIFICYKETAANGDRTLDSVIAQDVYDALTGKGYRVFFSRITLEDKLGQEYEPYIFAALHSAKIMLAFGTDYEYYNAVWVKNEWSRFLQLIAAGEKKTLIPCFKGIDAYDMPKEFARLQAQDMGKVGAIQDLLRGIEKIVGGSKLRAPASFAPSAGSVDAMVARGNFALEDGDFVKADEYFDKALDQNPMNGAAYLGKALAALNVSDKKQINDRVVNIDSFKDFLRAIQFSCGTEKEELESIYNEAKFKYLRASVVAGLKRVLSKEKQKIALEREQLYSDACRRMSLALSEERFSALAETFRELGAYKDSGRRCRQCAEKADMLAAKRVREEKELAAKRDAEYQQLQKIVHTSTDVQELREAVCRLKCEDMRAYADCEEFLALGEKNLENVIAGIQRREAEERERLRAEEQEKARKIAQQMQWRNACQCQYCGGAFKKGLFSTKCVNCGKAKDY